MKTAFVVAAAIAALAAPASAAQLILTKDSVIGSSATYSPNLPNYQAGNIFDNQTGTVADGVGQVWLAGDNRLFPGDAVGFITVDLGAAYNLTGFNLFNTHNGGFFDRGTKDFTILGSNEIAADGKGGFTLAGTLTRLANGSLTVNTTGGMTVADSFAALSPTPVRYIQFRAESVGAKHPYSQIAYGLGELRVFGDPMASAVPEPATWAMMILGFGLAGAAVRRQRDIAGPALA